MTGGEGKKQEITFRYRSLDQAADEQTVPASKTLYLTAVNDRTRATGFSLAPSGFETRTT